MRERVTISKPRDDGESILACGLTGPASKTRSKGSNSLARLGGELDTKDTIIGSGEESSITR